jgi:hypothetical protein
MYLHPSHLNSPLSPLFPSLYQTLQDFTSLDPYAPVKPLDVLAEEIGVKVEELVKLDANENLYGPVPEVSLFSPLSLSLRNAAPPECI